MSGSGDASAAQPKQHVFWCFTLHYDGPGQHTREEAVEIVNVLGKRSSYYVAGDEIAPSSGQRHFQGYLQLKKRARRTELVKLAPCTHFEPAKGNADVNDKYCRGLSDGKTPNEIVLSAGEMKASEPGVAEIDVWTESRRAAERGDFAAVNDRVYCSFYGNIHAIARDHAKNPPEVSEMNNLWIYGPPGVGKSRKARELLGEDVYLKMCNKWWDTYQNQNGVLIDDFDLTHAALGHHIKIWADRYPFLAEIKGRTVAIRPARIVVTSNYSPEDVWADELTQQAVRRRFKVVKMGDYPPRKRLNFTTDETSSSVGTTPVAILGLKVDGFVTPPEIVRSAQVDTSASTVLLHTPGTSLTMPTLITASHPPKPVEVIDLTKFPFE